MKKQDEQDGDISRQQLKQESQLSGPCGDTWPPPGSKGRRVKKRERTKKLRRIGSWLSRVVEKIGGGE